MARHIKVKPGRVPAPFATPSDTVVGADALTWQSDRIRSATDAGGADDDAVAVIIPASTALFGGNFGGNF